MTTALIEVPKTEIDGALAEAQAFTIINHEGLEDARDRIKGIKLLRKQIDDTYDPRIDEAYKLHKNLLADKKRFTAPLDQAEGVYKTKMSDRIRLEEAQARLEAERQAEEDRKKHEAELKRIHGNLSKIMEKHNDLQQKIDALEAEVNRADILPLEAEVILAQIAALEAQKDSTGVKVAEIQSRVAEKTIAQPMPIAAKAEKVSGVSAAKDYDIDVVNPAALAKAIAEGKVPVTVIKSWDITVMKTLVKAGVFLPGVSAKERLKIGVKA